MDTNNLIYLSVIIPAYNEEKRIKNSLQKLYDYFKTKTYNYEILIVNDGSNDNTLNILREYSFWENLSLINNKINRGKGYSVKRGVEKAKGELILISDCDLASPIEELEKLIMISHLKKVDIVLGSRNLKESSKLIKRSLKREIISRTFNLMVRTLLLPGIKDTQCGFKLFSKISAKQIFPKVKVSGFTFDVEALALARKFNYDIVEVAVKWKDVSNSTINIKKHAPKMAMDLILLWQKYRFFPKLIRTLELWH